jgi:hypothetical protein
MEIQELSNIAQVYMDPEATTVEKIELLTDKIKNNFITKLFRFDGPVNPQLHTPFAYASGFQPFLVGGTLSIKK